MLKDPSILAVIPARGGSKGIPLKNLRKIVGSSLIAHVASCLQGLSWIDRVVVTTDNQKIADEAVAHKLEVPFLRPPELATDTASAADTLYYCWHACEEHYKKQFDIVLWLEPTSPCRKPDHLTEAVATLRQHACDVVWSVSPVDLKYHPAKQLALDEAGCLSFCSTDGARIIARQQLSSTFVRNGIVYAIERNFFMREKTFMSNRARALVIEEPVANIDTLDDLGFAEKLLQAEEASNAKIF